MKELHNIDDRFFNLLQIAVGKTDCDLVEISDKAWSDIYNLATEQSLVSVILRAVDILGRNGNCLPKKYLLFQWIGESEIIKSQNQKVNQACEQLASWFKSKGYSSCILKGQGVASLYSNPDERQAGDIDLWVDGGMKRAMTWARTNYGDVAFDYINAHIPMFKETEVELHWRVRLMSNLIKNRRLQKWMEEHEEELLNTTIELPNGVGAIPVPSLALNRYYILLHCYNHIFSEGLGLRQIMDLYFVLAKNSFDKAKDTEFRKFFLRLFGIFVGRDFVQEKYCKKTIL